MTDIIFLSYAGTAFMTILYFGLFLNKLRQIRALSSYTVTKGIIIANVCTLIFAFFCFLFSLVLLLL